MPRFEAVADQVALLKQWASDLPRNVTQGSEVVETTSSLGERHGSWVLAIDWEQGGLSRSAELALTNPEATSDDTAGRAIVSVRASASTEERYVAEVLYERSRAASRLSEDELADLLRTAVDRAGGYSGASLVDSYRTGLESAD